MVRLRMLCVSFQVFDQIKAVVESVFQVLYFSMAYMVCISCISFFRASQENSQFSILNYKSACVGGELLAEALACEEDAALHGSYGEAELLCDLAVLVACDVHVEGDAELVVEGVEHRCDLLYGEASLRGLECGFLRRAEVVEVVGGVDDCGLAHVAAVVVDEDVAHDGHHPSLEVRVSGKLLFVVECLECGVLEEVGGGLAVGGELVCEAHEV